MKCLEFLYFYLMDETSPRPDLSIGNVGQIHLPPVSLSPPSPTKLRYFPQNSRNVSSSSDDSLTSSGSSRSSSTSGSSATSLSSSFTPAHTRFPSVIPKTPPSPTKPSTQSYAKPRTLLMLQKEVDFMPVTPKKSHVSRLGIGSLRPSSAPNSPFKNFRATPDEANTETDYRFSGNSFTSERDHVIS